MQRLKKESIFERKIMDEQLIKIQEEKVVKEFKRILIIVIASIPITYLLACSITGLEFKSIGEFGDIFGITTAIFSGLAFAGLWYSIRLQKIELRQTVIELSNSSKEQLRNNEISSLSTIINANSSLLQFYTSRLYKEEKYLVHLQNQYYKAIGDPAPIEIKIKVSQDKILQLNTNITQCQRDLKSLINKTNKLQSNKTSTFI